MRIWKQKQMNAYYQASLVNRHIRRFTGKVWAELWWYYFLKDFGHGRKNWYWTEIYSKVVQSTQTTAENIRYAS